MAKKQTKTALSPRQNRFVEKVVSGDTLTDAYLEAYPNSAKAGARRSASRLMTNVDIVQEIERRKADAARAAQVNEQQIIGELIRVAFGSIGEVLDSDGEFDVEKARRNGSLGLVKRISTSRNRFGVNRTIEMYSKMDALAKLAEYIGVRFRDRSEEEAVEKLRTQISILAQAEGRDYIEMLRIVRDEFGGMIKPMLLERLLAEAPQ